MSSPQPDIRSQSEEQLQEYLAALGQPAYRASQIHQWLWQKYVPGIEAMTNLPKDLRAQLAQDFRYYRLQVAHKLQSQDGSIKFAFTLQDGAIIEGVLIPAGDRVTACVSSQVGCSLDCKFCATGYLKLSRNLQAYEIYEQVQLLDQEARAAYGRGLSNIVYMGMGEPLLNYKNVLASIERIISPEGLGMSRRRITLSTSGVAKMITRLADDGFACEFALSLHSAIHEKRSRIMPINDSNPLDALAEALKYFHAKTGTRVTYEYILFDGLNDGPEDVEALIAFCRHVPSKVNIIEYNPIAEAPAFRFASDGALQRFTARLEQAGVPVTVRRSRGRDVDAACGQLALKQLG